ncbi:MAG: cytochrome c3 family protein [Candidatus Methylomirabilia bacterium]
MRALKVPFALLVALLGCSLFSMVAPLAAEPCSECHEKKEIGAGSRSVHPPFDEDDCTSCHVEHGDEGRLLLAEEGNALCEGCHESADAGFLKAHGGVRGTKVVCTSCHDPHRSTEEHLLLPNRHRPLAFGLCNPCHRFDGKLLKPVRELCLGCHDGLEFARRISHRPVKRGECLACHDPHVSRQPSLLKARYAPGRWIGREGDVALCLGCHDRRNFFSGEEPTTLFRTGGRNLHALHVDTFGPSRGDQPRQSLACRNCHEVHSSEEPRLVRRELDCGGVPCLRLEFRRTDSGGQCLSGCHAPQRYGFAAALEPATPAAPVPAVRAPAAAALPEQSALERSINKRCVACHEKDVKRFAKAPLHAPVRAGACSFCHLDHGPENRLILLGREDRICGSCHDPAAEASRTAHGGFPIAGSRCTECHDPHGGQAAGFIYDQRHPPFAEGDCGSCHGKPDAGWKIAEDVSEVCRGCHDEVGRETFPHGALAAKGCLGCHRAHAAREKALLRAVRPALCFTCHPRPRFAQQTIHDPVREGDCGSCHPAHGAANEHLLVRPYPIEQYLPFAAGRYGLCLECHDEGALTDPERGGDTGFANGARNLHALHLRDRVSLSELGTRTQPGITCRNCHEPHSTESQHLIRRVLDCNGVPCLQLEFKQIGVGGKCLGGCHVTQSYLPAGR